MDPAARGSVEVDDSTVCAYRAAQQEWEGSQQKREPGALPRLVLDERSYRIAKARLARQEAVEG